MRFFAGALRAYTVKQIGIFYVSTFAVLVLGSGAELEHFGLFPQWVEYLLIMLLIPSGAALTAFDSLPHVRFKAKQLAKELP
jgi:uncharacterized membrane protein